MSRKKKTRRVTDVMPTRKSDSKLPEHTVARSGKNRKPTRYELDLQARDAKKKRKHKGLPSGSRAAESTDVKNSVAKEKKDPRLGSRKKVPLMVEFVNQPEKGKLIKPVPVAEMTPPRLAPELELEQLENNECLHQLLDDLDAGKTLSAQDQQFVDSCLDRIHELMTELGIEDEDDNEDALLRQFETVDINSFR